MDTLERRLLQKLLPFCRERELIGAHRFDGDEIDIFVGAEPRRMTHLEAFKYLLRVVEEADESDEFLLRLRAHPESPGGRSVQR